MKHEVKMHTGADTIMRKRIKVHPDAEHLIDLINPVDINDAKKEHFIALLPLAGMDPPSDAQCKRYKELVTSPDNPRFGMSYELATRVVNYEARRDSIRASGLDKLDEDYFVSYEDAIAQVQQKVFNEEKNRRKREAAKLNKAAQGNLELEPMVSFQKSNVLDNTGMHLSPNLPQKEAAMKQPLPDDVMTMSSFTAEQLAADALKIPGVTTVQIVLTGPRIKDTITRFAEPHE